MIRPLLACLPTVLAVYSHYLRTASDPVARHPWFRPVLGLSVLALWLLLSLAARWAVRRLPSWLTVSGFAVSLLAILVVGFPALVGFGAPNEAAPARGSWSWATDLPQGPERIFREIRLVFWRNRSILQGTDRYAYLVGTPTPLWCSAMKAVTREEPAPKNPCDPINLIVWSKVDCRKFGLSGDYSCLSCEAGNWNHPKSHLVTLTEDCRQAVIYSGTGPSYEKVVRLAAIPAKPEEEGPYRFPPARFSEDSAAARPLPVSSGGGTPAPMTPGAGRLQALYEHLLSTAPAQTATGNLDPVILEAMRSRDSTTLDYFRDKRLGENVFREGLKSADAGVREESAVSLAEASKDPSALPVLLELVKRSPSPRVARAVGLYGSAAAPAVSSLLYLAEMRHGSYEPKDLIVPLIRIGTPEAMDGLRIFTKKDAFGYSGTFRVAGAVAELGSEARAAVPTLHQWLKETHPPADHLALIDALQKAGGAKEAAAHLPLLIAILETATDRYLATGAADILGKIGPAAAPATAALIKRFEREPRMFNYRSALEKIGTPEARGALKKQYPDRY